MEQVVLKQQNLAEHPRTLEDSQPAEGRPSISDPMSMTYQTDPLPGRMLNAIRINIVLHQITVGECTEEDGRLRYRGKLYVPDIDELRLRIIRDHHDTALAGRPRRAKMFDLLDRGYYCKEMRKDVDWYVQKCHDCQRSWSSRHSTIGVLRHLPVPDIPWEDISRDSIMGLPECEGIDARSVVVDPL